MQCMECGKELTPDEIGLYRKLFNRASETCKCIDCVSSYLSVDKGLLYQKIEEYKAMGCTLFQTK